MSVDVYSRWPSSGLFLRHVFLAVIDLFRIKKIRPSETNKKTFRFPRGLMFHTVYIQGIKP